MTMTRWIVVILAVGVVLAALIALQVLPPRKAPAGGELPSPTPTPSQGPVEGEVEVIVQPGIREITLKFESVSLRLAGVLTLPDPLSGPVPAVLLIADAGNVDRDSNGPGVTKVDFLKAVAHRLALSGIASFRYDKRGVGESAGKLFQASFQDLVDDAGAALALLRARTEVDAQRVFLLGHGEGAEIAALLAAAADADADSDSNSNSNPNPDRPQLAGLILVGGAARPLDQILLERIRLRGRALKRSQEDVQARLDRQESFNAFVRQSQGEWEDYRFEELKSHMPWLSREILELSLRPFALSWYRQHFAHDPRQTLKRVHVPVLIIQGDKDHLTPVGEADLLAEALRAGGNDAVQLEVLPDLNHLMRYQAGPLDVLSFNLDSEVDPRVTERIATWIRAILTSAASSTPSATPKPDGPKE